MVLETRLSVPIQSGAQSLATEVAILVCAVTMMEMVVLMVAISVSSTSTRLKAFKIYPLVDARTTFETAMVTFCAKQTSKPIPTAAVDALRHVLWNRLVLMVPAKLQVLVLLQPLIATTTDSVRPI